MRTNQEFWPFVNLISIWHITKFFVIYLVSYLLQNYYNLQACELVMTEIIDRSSIPGTVLLISDHIAIDIILSDHDRH